MSKGGKKRLRFVGYSLTRWQHREVISLIEMTSGRFGVHKKDFKNEPDFWAVMEALTGYRKSPLEDFIEASMRISRDVRSKGLCWRDAQMAEFTKEKVRALLTYKSPLSAPVTLYPTREFKSVGSAPTVAVKDEFYKSWEWRTLRMEVLKEHGRACQCCGAEPGMKTAAGEPVRICVDHIKPLSKFWHLRLDRTNLQVLCDECNQGKGNWDQTDFRPAQGPDEWVTDADDVDPLILQQLNVGTLQ